MKYLIQLVLIVASITASAQEPEQSAPDVYRDFLIAIVRGDKAAAAKLSVPGKNIDILFSSEPASPEAQKVEIARILANPYRIVKPGETIELPNGLRITAPEKPKYTNHVMIVNKTDPLPRYLLRMVGGPWKVHPGDLIAAKEAEAEVEAEAKKKAKAEAKAKAKTKAEAKAQAKK